MELFVFLRGLAIGFGIAAPVGPIGILCILCMRRTIADGRAVGGLFLCYLGVRTWMAAPAATAEASRRGPGLLTTCLLYSRTRVPRPMRPLTLSLSPSRCEGIETASSLSLSLSEGEGRGEGSACVHG